MLPLLDVTRRLVIGHRGAPAEAPENTLPSFARALERGADALELDVRLSADGVAMVVHDPTLDRTTDRSGPVAACTASALHGADAGAPFSPDGGRTFPWAGLGVRIPTLAEVLRAFPATPLLIELKVAAAAGAVRRELLEAGAAARCVVASFERDALAPFREPPFLRAATQREILRLWIGSQLGFALAERDCRCFAVPPRHRHLTVLTDRFLLAARRIERPVHVWTVDDPALAATLWGRGVTGIITNDPGAMPSRR